MRLRTPSRRKAAPAAALALIALGAATPPELVVGAPPPTAGGLRAPPSRIVSTAPGFTEILFALGADSQVVAVSDYCIYPEAARAKAKIGGPFNLNYERLVALRADVIILPKSLSGAAEKARTLGLRVESLPNETVSDLVESIERLGALTGRDEAARGMIAEIRGELDAEPARGSKAPVRALIVVFRAAQSLQDLTVASRDTFLSELLTHAGGQNVVSTTISRYPRLSKEELISLDPDVILDLTYTAGGEDAAAIWAQLPTLKAVRSGRVVSLPDPSMTVPGPRMVQTLRRFREVLDP